MGGQSMAMGHLVRAMRGAAMTLDFGDMDFRLRPILPGQDRDALLRRVYLDLCGYYCEMCTRGAGGAPRCYCHPGHQCVAHRTHALLVEIYSLLVGA